MASRPHHRPTPRESAFFDEVVAGTDPAQLREAADRVAAILVRGARESGDGLVAERVVHLAETEDIETLAEVWSGSPADSLAGCLWRLYLLRSWVYADPVTASREFDAGRLSAPVARVVAGVGEPPGPDELQRLVDEVLRGIVTSDFADVLFRAAAFTRVVATGRASLPEPGAEQVQRMLALSEQLEAAAHLELADALG